MERAVGEIIIAGVLKPIESPDPGANASSSESSWLATQIVPLESNATLLNANRPALDVNSLVAGVRAPLVRSWLGSSRMISPGAPLTVHSPS